MQLQPRRLHNLVDTAPSLSTSPHPDCGEISTQLFGAANWKLSSFGDLIAGGARFPSLCHPERTGRARNRLRLSHRSLRHYHSDRSRPSRNARRLRRIRAEIMRERVKTGIAQARAKGITLGRPQVCRKEER